MANVKVKSYVRGKKRVRAYTRKARPHYGKKIKYDTERFLVKRDEFGQIRGYVPLNEVRKMRLKRKRK